MLSFDVMLWGGGAIAAIGVALLLYFKGHRAGVAEARAKTAQARVDAIEVAHDATLEVDELTPAQQREELIKWSKS